MIWHWSRVLEGIHFDIHHYHVLIRCPSLFQAAPFNLQLFIWNKQGILQLKN